MIQTLVVGPENETRHILQQALEKRKHNITVDTVETADINTIDEKNITMVIVSEINPDTLGFCRNLKNLSRSKSVAIITVADKNEPEHLDDIIDAGVDQCIIESIYDEKRLHIRLAFAEKLAREKVQQQITEQRLRESEAKARSILETTVDAIITIDPKGIIRTFNKTAEKLFQYDSSEVIGKNVKILMPDPYKTEHDDYISHYHETGEKKIIGIGREVTGRRKDGTTFPMYLAVSEVKLPDQHIFTGIVRDISEQRRLEQEVLRISEHERRRIGQDLHDGLGQMLTGIGLISKNHADILKKENHSSAETAKEITELIKEADEYARTLARGLVPVEFEQKGLETALDRLRQNAIKLFNIECELTITGDPAFEDATQAIHMYRIAQEGVSNAVKHGGATKVSIHLASSERHIRLRVMDNGTGFPENWDSEGGLGVRIMQFRARLIGGSLEISNRLDGGATVTCTMIKL